MPIAVIESGLFHRFEKTSLAECEDDGGGDHLRALAGRHVVILAAKDDVSVARALRDARMIADAGASAVGLALGTGSNVLRAVERGLRAGLVRVLRELAAGLRC